jgi:hypothetical protein
LPHRPTEPARPGETSEQPIPDPANHTSPGAKHAAAREARPTLVKWIGRGLALILVTCAAAAIIVVA